jgi:predicted nuclease of restriction endonuclease-like (RecB) superfamily
MSELTNNDEYKKWLSELKFNIKRSQIKAALAVNSQLIHLYWNLGEQIIEKQKNTAWGSSFIDQLSTDLKTEFPEVGGFSSYNLRVCKNFYLFYNQLIPIWEQAVPKLELNEQVDAPPPNILLLIPWGHHVLILKKIKHITEAIFYINQTIENNWSRAVLEYQIEINLYQRQGNAITNFKSTLPEPESDLAQSILKDTYNFEFLTLSSKVKELELEQKLIDNISQFLLELGKGFAYMGRQYEINVGSEIFKTDLLFYHTKLKCYVVIELKVTKFKPEYIGKLNFYLTAIDRLIKDDADKPTIGILLCKSKNDVVVDFALHDVNKPMGISEYTYKQLPENIKSALPTIQELTQQLEI